MLIFLNILQTYGKNDYNLFYLSSFFSVNEASTHTQIKKNQNQTWTKHTNKNNEINYINRPASSSYIDQAKKFPRSNNFVSPPPLVFKNNITEYMVTGNNVFELYVSKVFPSSLVFLDSKFKFDILHGSFAYTVILT